MGEGKRQFGEELGTCFILGFFVKHLCQPPHLFPWIFSLYCV